MNPGKKDSWSLYWGSIKRSFIEQKIQSYKAKNGYAKLLRAIPEIESNGRSLEIGAGKAFMSHILRDRGWYTVAIDLDRDIVKNNRDKVDNYVVGDMLNIPFDKNSFDLVMSCGLIEHFTLDVVREIFSECKRVGKSVVAWFPSCGTVWKMMWGVRNLFGGNIVTEAYAHKGKAIENILISLGFNDVRSGSVLFGGLLRYLYVYGTSPDFSADNAAKKAQ